MKTETKKLFVIKENTKGYFLIGIYYKAKRLGVTTNIKEATFYREDKIDSVLEQIEILTADLLWEKMDSGETYEAQLPENIGEYKDAVINGILAKFSDIEKSGVHAVNYKYIEDMVSMTKDEHGEYDLPHPTIITTSWSDCYQDDVSVEDAVDQMFDGCHVLYVGHMSVL